MLLLFLQSSTYYIARDQPLKERDFINRGHQVMGGEKCKICRRPKVYKLAPYQSPVMEKFINSFNYVAEPSWPSLKLSLAFQANTLSIRVKASLD